MFDYRNLFGFAAILFGAGFFVQSLQSANAKIGPSISLGSNPIQHFYQNCDQQNNFEIFTNNSSGDFIIGIPNGLSFLKISILEYPIISINNLSAQKKKPVGTNIFAGHVGYK